MASGLAARIRADARGDPGRAARALHANLKDFRSLGAGYNDGLWRHCVVLPWIK